MDDSKISPQSTISPANTSLAATLEVCYLRQTLLALAQTHPDAIDVGAHRGDVTDALAELGFRVLAIEPQPQLAQRLRDRFATHIELDLVHIESCAASNQRGTASLFVGSASTVTTLEEKWTQVAFPEEFLSPRRVEVPLYTIAEMMRAAEFDRPAFVKIDVEGHELPALEGLFNGSDPSADVPPIVMFEANQRFADSARGCLRLLASRGYDRFDIFIREGIAPIAAERFGPALVDGDDPLPAAWFGCGDKYFYANVIAYHNSVSDEIIPADPMAIMHAYHIEAARDVLRRALKLEAAGALPVHPIWTDARAELRDYLLNQDWREFLSNPVCRFMFFRGRWGIGQDRELATLKNTDSGRTMLDRTRDPRIGSPRLSEQVPGLSTNMLGMAYYLHRIQECTSSKTHEMPQSVIEIGGGYGAFAWLYARENPNASYTILDLPEMLAIQHYFLTLALPGRCIRFAADSTAARAGPGEILLYPAPLLQSGSQLRCDLLFSTFGFSEMPRELQRQIETVDYFAARYIFLAGQLSSESPDAHLVAHSEVVGAAMQQFEQMLVERFHTGNNYLLLGTRSAA